MAILTPVTLWKDFDDTLPLDEEIVAERVENGAIIREVFFGGRQTEKGRVNIFAKYVFPANETVFPAVMILFEAGLPADMKFVRRFVARGYGVLCVDYCGGDKGEKHTFYPEDVDYANFARAGRAIDRAEPTARETSWYEWAGVARYAARYLNERPEVTKIGAIGLRTGGEVLFKIAPYAPLSCMISVCAAGWLAYRGIDKFTEEKQRGLDEERHRFIAGIDSQSYAPYVKCPLLLISAVNDKKYNYDRVYDTFRQINPEVEKAILFSSHGNGLIGSHSLADIDLFLDKYLKGRSVYVSAPVSFSVGEDGEGNLAVTCKNDPSGELVECGYFFTEKITSFRSRGWTRVLCDPESFGEDNTVTVPLGVYDGSGKVLLYTFARYSNGFSVTSKIKEITLEKRYKNACPGTRVIYTSREELNGFSAFRSRARSIADCFADGTDAEVKLCPGYGGIIGITSPAGLISYRVSEPRYEPSEGVSFAFDAWAAEGVKLKVTFYTDEEEQAGYSCSPQVAGGGKWKNVVLDADDFKSETGASLSDFKGVVSVVFFAEKEVLINNVVWL